MRWFVIISFFKKYASDLELHLYTFAVYYEVICVISQTLLCKSTETRPGRPSVVRCSLSLTDVTWWI